jgi:hypothetical protein
MSYRWQFLSLLCLLPWAPSAAQANSITIYDTMSNPWSVSWVDPRVTGVFDETDRTDGNLTKQTTNLTKIVNFNQALGFQPIVLTFEQEFDAGSSYGGAAGNPNARAGLNFILRNEIENDTGRPWTGFQETLVDRDRQGVLGQGLTDVVLDKNLGSDDHPVISHFHTDGASFGIDQNPASWAIDSNFTTNGGDRLVLDDQLNEPPSSELQSGSKLIFHVRVHDIVVAGAIRRFDLIETPVAVPEPATLTLTALGLAGAAIRRRRRSRSAS